MKKVALILSVLLVAVFIFGCASTPSTTPTIAKPTTAAPPVTATTSAAPPPSSTAPAATSAAPTTSQPIKIGAIFSLTGETAVDGPFLKAAIEYRLEQAGYQAGGRKVQLIIEDDATNPTTGVDKARKLVQSDKVDVIIGPLNGAVVNSVANFLAPVKIPHLIFMPNPANVLALGGSSYLPYGTLEGTGYYTGQYAFDKLGYKTASVLFEDYVAGQQLSGGAMQAFKAKGGTIVQSQAIKMGTLDFSPYLSTLKDANCVIFWFTPMLAQRFVTQYFDAGLKMPLIIPAANVLIPPVLQAVGDKAIGITGIQAYTAALDTDLNKAYVADFSAKKNLIPSAQGSCADVCTIFYLEAVKATGGDTSYDKINEALHKIKITAPAGMFSFAANNLGIGDQYVTKVTKTPSGALIWGVIDKFSQVPFDMPR
jgi:branched-chain amino acid transport system substrate-binding protein